MTPEQDQQKSQISFTQSEAVQKITLQNNANNSHGLPHLLHLAQYSGGMEMERIASNFVNNLITNEIQSSEYYHRCGQDHHQSNQQGKMLVIAVLEGGGEHMRSTPAHWRQSRFVTASEYFIAIMSFSIEGGIEGVLANYFSPISNTIRNIRIAKKRYSGSGSKPYVAGMSPDGTPMTIPDMRTLVRVHAVSRLGFSPLGHTLEHLISPTCYDTQSCLRTMRHLGILREFHCLQLGWQTPIGTGPGFWLPAEITITNVTRVLHTQKSILPELA